MTTKRLQEMPSGLGIVIIGAGMSGILMGIRLKQAGYDRFTILEKSSDVGGTWRDNSYPGLHCDVPSHHYRYTFEANPDWTQTYAAGPEIHRYLRDTAEKYGIVPHIRFNAAGTQARWTGASWEVGLSTGETIAADVLISASGVLRIPAYPDVPGRENFAGPSFHTSDWNHGIDLTEKRLGVIGTGSTAVQIVCALSGKIRKLKLFQRTPQWVARIANDMIPETSRQEYRANPASMEALFAENEALIYRQTGGAIMGRDPVARAELEQNVLDNLLTVKDPVLRQKLTPDYQVGCKRLIISPSFYEAVQDQSVELVTDRIDHIEARGIVTSDGVLHELDVLAYGTGFDPNAYIRPMELIGDEGHRLEDIWSERPTAYRSLTVPHMPNFFMIEGPFSPIGNLSLILVSEWQAEYIMKCLDVISRERIAMAPKPDITQRIMAEYREAAKSTIWGAGGCVSWYQDKEGVPIIYPFSPDEFRDEIQRDPDLDDYEVRSLPRVGA